MFKTKYYYFVSGLPDIVFNDTKSKIHSEELYNELSEHLEEKDFELTKLIRLNHDNYNLLNRLLNNDKSFIHSGIYSEEELEDQIKEPTLIIDYLKQFILEFHSEDNDFSDLYRENKLLTYYYDYVSETNNQFLNQWFTFDRDIKNIFTAFHCRKYNYDLKTHLIKGKQNNDVYEYLASDTPKYELLLNEVIMADKILQIADSDDDAVEKEHKIDKLKWEFINDNTFFNYFTVEKILGFILKLHIVERWTEHDTEKGEKLLRELINDLGIRNIQVN